MKRHILGLRNNWHILNHVECMELLGISKAFILDLQFLKDLIGLSREFFPELFRSNIR